MTRIILFKRGAGLFATDDESHEALSKIGEGKQVTCEIKRARNPQHHRLFFALVKMVWDNSDHERYPSMDAMRAAILVSAGHREEIHLPGGQVCFIPRSISFGKCDQGQFDKIYQHVCDVVARHFLPGVTSDELRAEVLSMIGAR